MNRDLIEKGRTGGKFSESFALFGGVGAIVYPIVFWWMGWMAIDERDDTLTCRFTKAAEHDLKGEDYDDYLRFAMFWNMAMMVVYLCLHYVIFARPESHTDFKKYGIVFAVVISLELIFAAVNLILAGISICNGEGWGVAAIGSSLCIIVINLFTIVTSSLYFCVKTRVVTAQVDQQPAASA